MELDPDIDIGSAARRFRWSTAERMRLPSPTSPTCGILRHLPCNVVRGWNSGQPALLDRPARAFHRCCGDICAWAPWFAVRRRSTSTSAQRTSWFCWICAAPMSVTCVSSPATPAAWICLVWHERLLPESRVRSELPCRRRARGGRDAPWCAAGGAGNRDSCGRRIHRCSGKPAWLPPAPPRP